MSSNVIQENYSNVLDYLAKTFSIFKCHFDYSQKLTEDCNSLFQLGKILQKDYEKLLESTNTMEVSTNLEKSISLLKYFYFVNLHWKNHKITSQSFHNF